MMTTNRISLLVFIALALVFSSCHKKVGSTTVEINDPNRHYYAILQGQELELLYTVLNTGEEPLIIKDIQPSCGCLIVDKEDHDIILPKKKGYVRLKYNSTKNVGYVKHYIRIYGNFASGGMVELQFDVNVVPDADYTRDYEELFRESNIKNGIVNEAVDGKESQRGYYVGNP